jgi:hypothetical protein
MKRHYQIILVTALCSTFASVNAQFGPRGGMPRGPQLGGSTARLFGENSAFSATLEMQTKRGSADEGMKIPGKITFDHGNSRFEMDMTQMSGSKLPADAATQMKSMGMDKMVVISRSDKKVSYLVYPGLQSYAENPLPETEAAKPESDYKFETTELGRETIDGHPCVKNKAVVTDPQGNKYESTIWNATDLKKFPIKIEQIQPEGVTTMLFKNVNFATPEASIFDPPTGFTRYESMQTMMQQQMMKRFGAGQAQPPRSQ